MKEPKLWAWGPTTLHGSMARTGAIWIQEDLIVTPESYPGHLGARVQELIAKEENPREAIESMMESMNALGMMSEMQPFPTKNSVGGTRIGSGKSEVPGRSGE